MNLELYLIDNYKPTGKCMQLSDMLILLPRWLSGKEPARHAGDPGLIPGLGRSPGEGNGNPLQSSCLGNPMDRGTWQVTVKGSKRVKHNLLIKPSPPSFCRTLNLTKSQYSHPYSVLNNIIILGYLTYSYMSLIIYQEVPKCFTNTTKFNLHVKPISTITIPVL